MLCFEKKILCVKTCLAVWFFSDSNVKQSRKVCESFFCGSAWSFCVYLQFLKSWIKGLREKAVISKCKCYNKGCGGGWVLFNQVPKVLKFCYDLSYYDVFFPVFFPIFFQFCSFAISHILRHFPIGGWLVNWSKKHLKKNGMHVMFAIFRRNKNCKMRFIDLNH